MAAAAVDRARADRRKDGTEKEAAGFERYTQQAINDVDRTARLVKHEFEQNGAVDLPLLMQEGLVDGSGLVVLNIADAKGNIIARSQPSSPFNIADREFFRLHAKRDTGLLDISKPVASRASGRPTILLSRRMNKPDGSFGGVVLLAVTAEYFVS